MGRPGLAQTGFLLVVIAALVLGSGAAAAAGRHAPDLPRPDPKGTWRKITWDDATTTSKCIGDLSTPLCALETVLASPSYS